MNNIYLALEGAWRVLLASLLLGAGLPSLFAAGVRAMAYGAGGDAEDVPHRPHPVGRVLAYVLFALVVAVIGLGIAYIVASGFGYHIVFDQAVPTFQKKG